MRVGAVLLLSSKRIREKLDAGEQTRKDNFFEADTTGRSQADEIAESVITKAQRETEEKKLPLMANMLANIAFSEEINVAFAQQLIKAAESLTYRQLCILSMIGRLNRSLLRSSDYRNVPDFQSSLMQVLFEIYGLYQQGFINCGGVALLGANDVIPSSLTVQGPGAHLYSLMELTSIPIEDIAPIFAQLR